MTLLSYHGAGQPKHSGSHHGGDIVERCVDLHSRSNLDRRKETIWRQVCIRFEARQVRGLQRMLNIVLVATSLDSNSDDFELSQSSPTDYWNITACLKAL
jgi:hypothetical protein